MRTDGRCPNNERKVYPGCRFGLLLAAIDGGTRSRFGAVPDMTEEEHQRRSDDAGKLWRELVRRAAAPEGE